MSIDVGTCNAGKCVPPAATTCKNDLICSGTKCKTSCDADADCIKGDVCLTHQCYPQTFDKTLNSEPSLTGTASSDNKTSTPLGLGDDASNNQRCLFLSFSLKDVPKGSVLIYANLEFWGDSQIGNPYKDLGAQQAQHLKYSAFNKDVFKIAPSGSVDFPDSIAESWHLADVTDMVQADVTAGASYSQFRICFSKASDNDKTEDFFKTVTSGDDQPTLYVSYHR
jgi:hypothetical protein